MNLRKAFKAARLLRVPFWRRAMFRHGVGAAIEHVDAISFCAPKTLIDVGANKGQFSAAVRGLLPDTAIHAFEPLPEAGATFSKVFAGDSRYTLYQTALGATEAAMTFYVTNRDDSSSLLRPGEEQSRVSKVDTQREITVPVAPLSKFLDLSSLPRPVMLKIDVQGFELQVLKGIAELDQIDFIYAELSFVELYEGQALYEEVCAFLKDKGFHVRGVFNQWYDARLGPVQVDCLFGKASENAT